MGGQPLPYSTSRVQSECHSVDHRAHREDEADARHLVDDQGLKAVEEDAEVVRPPQPDPHGRDVHQVSREQQTEEKHLRQWHRVVSVQ